MPITPQALQEMLDMHDIVDMVRMVNMINQLDVPSTKAIAKPKAPVWDMRLYIAGETTKSIAAISNLRQLCEKHLPGIYRIEVIDLVKHPELAMIDQIVAVPTLVRNLPHPIRKMIGNLSSVDKVLNGLEICQVEQD